MRKYFRNQKGFSLIEVLISLTLVSILSVTFLGALGTAPKTVISTDERQTAKVIAEAQMEYVKSLASADGGYTPLTIPAEYTGYSVLTEDGKIPASYISGDEKLQKVTITIQRGGKTAYVLEGYKAR